MATVESSSLIDQIGEIAGAVWHTLLEHEQLTISQLAKEVDAPRDRVMQAIGWLAREDKINVEQQARRKIISLR